MRILVDENIPQGREVFSAYGEVAVFAGRSLRREDLQSADALLVRSVTRVGAPLLGGTPVRFVGTATIGVDHVDRTYLDQAGIGFASAPGCNARSVGEYLVAALLHLHVHRGLPLAGKTLGIVGCGHVGSQAAVLAPFLGLKVLRCDPPLAETGAPGPFTAFRDLVASSDILTFHVPLTETGPFATQGMVNQRFFQSFQAAKTLINTSRGEVTEEKALLWALDRGLVNRLVLDVFPGEPSISPILAEKADIITPHIAGYSIQGKLNGTRQILEAFCRHFGLKKTRDPVYPQPPHPDIPLQTGTDDLSSNLHHYVANAYPIGRDDAELRASLQSAGLPGRFDELRRRYPERHEFAGFRVNALPKHQVELRKRLSGLGFLVDVSP